MKDPIKQLTKRLRIWSAGCSTGEEPHTLAICSLEEQEKLLKGWNVEIIATDLNDRPIEVASAGVYGDYAMRFVSDLFKRKYFKPAPDGKKLEAREEVKKLIEFKRLNLRDDAKLLFMKGMDLIYCCNVLIYFDSASKSRVIQHYYNNLNTGGYLFLGISESLYQLNDQFRLVHFPGAFGSGKRRQEPPKHSHPTMQPPSAGAQAGRHELPEAARQKISSVKAIPAMPMILMPLLELLQKPADQVPIDEVVRLVSYDKTIAAQCIRIAGSPLFGLSRAPETIRSAVLSMGITRLKDVVLTFSLGQILPAREVRHRSRSFLAPLARSRHGCKKFCEITGALSRRKPTLPGCFTIWESS